MGADYIPTTLLELRDTPSSFSGQVAKVLAVAAGETTTEWVAQGGGHTTDAVYAEDEGVVADGVTDDTAAIQAINDGLASSGGLRRVIFPHGKTCLTSGQINFDKAGVFWDYMSLKLEDGASSVTAMLNVSADNIGLDRCRIDGNVANNMTLAHDGLRTDAVSDFWLTNSIFTGFNARGVFFFYSVGGQYNERMHIANNIITDTGFVGMVIRSTRYSNFIGNKIFSTGGHGITIERGDASGNFPCEFLNFTGGNIVNRATPPTSLFAGLGGSENGFLIALDFGCEYININSNIFWDNRNAVDDGIGLGIDGTEANLPKNCNITSNIVGYAGSYGIDASLGFNVADNIIYRPGTSGIAWAADGGDPYRDTRITGNQIIDCGERITGQRGIYVVAPFAPSAAVSHLTIADNLVKDTRGSKKTAFGISIDASNLTLNNLIIKGNDLTEVSNKSILITTPGNITRAIVKDNLELDTYETFANGDTTPSVLGKEYYKSSDSGATTRTSFDDGTNGQKIYVVHLTANTTYSETGNIKVMGGATKNPAVDDVLVFCFDGTTWREVAG